VTARVSHTSPRQAAILAGMGYLIIFVLAMFANFVVREGLIEPGDAAATYANIAADQGLFRAGTVSFLIVFVLDVLIAWALYVLFKGYDRDLSLLAAWLRLTYTVLLGVAVVFMVGVIGLVSGAEHLAAFDQAQLEALVTILMNAFDHAWLVGLACFGVHLVALAYLMLASDTAPRLLAFVVALAGLAYVVDTAANILLVSYEEYASYFLMMVAAPSIIGEMWLAFWLLLRAGKETVGGTT